MTENVFPKSQLPIRKTVELLPQIFQTNANDKFMSAVVDPLVQPGSLEKIVGYIGRRYGKTYTGSDLYLDTDNTLRSRYQLEPGVVYKENEKIKDFYDYLDLKNQLVFFGNSDERDNKIMSQQHFSWNPPIDWDKFINYREYYWQPSGPPALSVLGQSGKIRSTYSVKTGIQSTFIFTPDGQTNNPTLTLYRGQTYNFKINAPGDGFVIRRNYDAGSLLYRPEASYAAGQLAVYNEKLWRAKTNIAPLDGSTINLETEDWEFVEDISSLTTELDYNKGVINNGTENETLIFEIPLDAPDALYYQSKIDPNKVGKFIIADIESNTKINIEKEILGKTSYTSSNNVEFSNGMVVTFIGQVTPSKYSSDNWLVEGVGSAITLTKFVDLVVPRISQSAEEVLFDQAGFDTEPFDDAELFPGRKDYITIAKDSLDRNPWSRYNRWFHRSVLEYSYTKRGQDFPADETLRAKRPIIEFESNIQLFNHGSFSGESVDYVDDYTTDIFSMIEGSNGYNIDGENLFDGARILVINDTDLLSNNKIYKVTFITHNNKRQIALREVEDSTPAVNRGVLVKRGLKNGGQMFHFDGVKWNKSQTKTDVNQAPLFDIFDENGISFGDLHTYETSNFKGCKLFSYKQGSSIVDSELGFSLSYLNIDNVGDIQFNWNCDIDTFTYYQNEILKTEKISTGFYKKNPDDYLNGWILTDKKFIQPIIDSVKITSETNVVEFFTIDWPTDGSFLDINLYVNNERIYDNVIREVGKFTFTSRMLTAGDILTIKIATDIPPNQGYYEIPVGLEKNPLNEKLISFTLGEAVNHVSSALEFSQDLVGPVLGSSNLRDISGYSQHAKRFLKHSGLTPISISLLCDKTINLIKSLQYAKKSYIEFKNNFLEKALELPYNDNPIDFVDDIISELAKTKNTESPFWDSDMIGSGAYNSIEYVVEDTGIKTFSLSQKFNLKELSRRAVYIYLNGNQLLNSRDYEFNSTFGFVTLTIDLNEGDVIQIREYISTAFNQIPPTPTVLGLYKKYIPSQYIDDTYIEPREVIQGHDGSISFIRGDFRDRLILELEYRIYNNIKQEYDPSVFDIDQILGGYYGNSEYDKDQLNPVVNQEFLRWIQNTDINYTLNTHFKENETFTYTYSNMTDPTGTKNLPGYWRGVYQWFYDTTRPHTHPWEMLGFSIKPLWWEDEYGPAPYTKHNLILWEDIRDGIIRQGNRAGSYDRYKRPSIMKHLPVDGDGKLLSPLDSGLAGNFTLINNRGPFVLGDLSPVEYAWRSSSEWPFALVIALTLLKPLEFINDNFDKSRIKLNKLNQPISQLTNDFLTLSDLIIPRPGEEQASGLVQYIVGYAKSKGMLLDEVEYKIKNLDVKLSSRLSGFVDKSQQKYILDSKNPKSSNNSIFIPSENYDIIFNISSPISSVTYSGVIVEKTNGGWLISGYDDINPYFSYYEASVSQSDPVISVGGISETFVDWFAKTTYSNGQLVRFRNEFYRSLKTHLSSEEFLADSPVWKKLPDIPVVGAVEALRRKSFNTLSTKTLSYGSKLTTIQSVVDFLLGYELYLQSIGFKFDSYDTVNKVVQNWTTSCKEFMFWTKHNWAEGSLITLSPSAQKIDIAIPVGVADSLVDGFYNYQVLKDDGKILPLNLIDVNRTFQNITVETVNTEEGIYFLKVYYVLKEHVVVFDDRTVFNDVIYEKSTGYRQERIKTQGFRTVDWDGDYTSPGFIFDNVNIAVWQPFTDYRLGDIVAYKSYFWTSQKNQLGSEEFDVSSWSKLDLIPEKGLVSNFDYKINQIEDYYNVYSQGVGQTERQLARHAVAYQERDYLQNLSQDPVTQFQLYQGFIKEKGSLNSVNKVFDKMGRSIDSSVEINEEWAFRVGRFGGIDQTREVEFKILKDKLTLNPQPIVVKSSLTQDLLKQEYQIDKSSFSIVDTPFVKDINPLTSDIKLYRTPGYVNLNDVNFAVSTRDDILNIDISTIEENDHIWVTFDSSSWNVLRYNESLLLRIVEVSKTDNNVTVTLSRRHNISVGDIVGIKNIINLEGFFKVIDTGFTTITVETENTDSPVLQEGRIVKIYTLSESRFLTYSSLNQSAAALLKTGSRLWIDNAGNDSWEVIEKKKQYNSNSITNFGISNPLATGSSVLYSEGLNRTFASMPLAGYVMSYAEGSTGLVISQIIPPPSGFEDIVLGSFGTKIALSSDDKFLIVSSPLASGVPSNFQGNYDPDQEYFLGDIVIHDGRLWRAVNDISRDVEDGSTINVYTQDWEPATSIPANLIGRGIGYRNQGMISIYEYKNLQWQVTDSLISPRPEEGEEFGASVLVTQSGSDYYMAVSAPGSLNGTGRVYLYKYVPNQTLAQTFSVGTNAEIDYNTNTIIFDTPHEYYDGQKVTYINGTTEGQDKSTASSPAAPSDNTIFYVIKIDQNRIRLAEQLKDVVLLNSINLLSIGIDDSSSHTLIKEIRPTGWQQLENTNYKGIWNENIPADSENIVYPAGSIVWYSGNLYRASEDVYKIEDPIIPSSTNQTVWQEISDISTSCSLPTSASLFNDGSSLSIGVLNSVDEAELVKIGDRFGHSLASSKDGSILVVGAPEADGKYFSNYRGVWQPNIEYVENDVVKFINENYDHTVESGYIYYKLVDTNDNDQSTLTSINDNPSESNLWEIVDDSSVTMSGKIFIYQRSKNENYQLIQTITSDNIKDINDLEGDISINMGDQFGFAIDVDYAGSTIVISSPKADLNYLNQGSVYVFKTDSLSSVNYRLKQKLESFETHANEMFGQSVSISANTEKIVVGAKNSPYKTKTKIDESKGTIFDNGKTTFSFIEGYAGGVYVFEIKDNNYFLVEKLEADFSPYESFGSSIDCTGSVIVVGSPDYISPDFNIAEENVNSPLDYYRGTATGTVRLFRKPATAKSWDTISSQSPLVDIDLIKSISLYDFANNLKIQDLDYVDHAKLKILNRAEQEISFKTLYDPATYNTGTEDQVVDPDTAWAEKQVGKIWWDLSTAKWKCYEQRDQSYRVGNWNSLAEGASIDVYEWVETVLLPSEWSALADTNEGLAEGISGQPLYPDDNVYTVKEFYNPVTGQSNGTTYYYWVKNRVVIPEGNPGRRISAAEVASLINNPAGSGNAFVALISSNTILAYNFKSIISTDEVWLNIQYYKNKDRNNLVHNEYQLLVEGVAGSIPTEKLENKWLDSLIGYNSIGNRVPDPNLPIKNKYGIAYRPNQSMFVNRTNAIKLVIDYVNNILLKEPFSDTINLSNLSKIDEPPIADLNVYDQTIDTDVDLITVGTVRVRQARLSVNIIDGSIESIDILDSGSGYKVSPPIVIDGDGRGAKAIASLNNQGGISSITIVSKGKKYTTAIATVRSFSVLVTQDSTAAGFWSIYAWDNENKVFYRTQTQAYNTTKYWEYIDWWKEGYSITSRIVKEISNISEEPTISLEIGDLVSIREYANGGWAVFEKYDSGNINFLENYRMVGRQGGTIRIKDILYKSGVDNIGYDNSYSYDTRYYDIDSSKELSFILKAIKNDIFIGTYSVEWNKLFFACIRYVLAEQQYVDWVFKTSLITATHNIGSLEQKLNYKNDNLESFQEYLDEVKPYRTTIREYVSKYDSNEPSPVAVADFDLPASYSIVEGKIVPVKYYSSEIQQYPWKWWADNNGFSVVAIEISDAGEKYTSPPKVLIEGNGSGAEAIAYISNGEVSSIVVTNQGSGYTTAPIVSLVGGNQSSKIATAVAILGNTKVRTFNLTIKFDRVSKDGIYNSFDQTQTFVASGYSSVFDLNYAPTRDKTKISIYKNNQLVLNNEYSINLYRSLGNTYKELKGKITFNNIPLRDDIIVIRYEKNEELLDSVNRIQKYYFPSSGMKGVSTSSFVIQTKTAILNSKNIELSTTKDIRVGMRVTGDNLIDCRVVEILSENIIIVSIPQSLTAGSSLRFSYTDPSQLMTGIDFGGVQVQGTTFEVTGGWDALPWFTDNWDSVESSADYYVVCDGSTTTVTLPFIPLSGQLITVYLKRATPPSVTPGLLTDENTYQVEYDSVNEESITVRIDDPNYDNNWDSSVATNPHAQMPTFIGDGSTSVIEIGRYISTNAGDTLIFRPAESDGSVSITDTNLLDTNLSGGSFLKNMAGAYTTATGILAEEIIVDGSEFISPDQVASPEENVPGQVLDSVSIKVFNTSNAGSAPLNTQVYISNGTTLTYGIGLRILEESSLMVYVDKVRRYTGESLLDYVIDFKENNLTFNVSPEVGSIIEIISIGLGGINLLDYREYIADGESSTFLTSANYSETEKTFVTVNGIETEVGFLNSLEFTEVADKTLIQFGIAPKFNDVIRIVCLGSKDRLTLSRADIIKVNSQMFTYEGSTRTFEIDNFVNNSAGSAISSTVVELNNRYLNGVDTNYYVIDSSFVTDDGSRFEFPIGVDPSETPGSILSSNITVFVNGNLQTFIQDYIYDGTRKVVYFDISKLNFGDIVKIENDLKAEYRIVENSISIDPSVILNDEDTISLTWFGEYPSMQIISDEYDGGKVYYQLSYKIFDTSYVWVYKNGVKLTQDKDFYVSVQRGSVYLSGNTQPTDKIKIVLFGSNKFKLPAAYEIYKDMLNIYHYKRFSIKDTVLVADLNYYDLEILVNDATYLDTPNELRKTPGVVYINGERIEYFAKDGNTLSRIRRGCNGTSIGNTYKAGTLVVNLGPSELIPYNETQDRFDFISDGSSLLIGPLDFVPTKSSRDFYRITSTTVENNSIITNYLSIPSDYGLCNEIEVFVAGRRLRKDSIKVYDETLGSSSPAADIELEAEFSVDGGTGYVRLTTPAPAGARIFVIRRTGKTWYDRGINSASNGVTLLDNNTAIAKFIAQSSTKLPE
jgi:hypothetical protein